MFPRPGNAAGLLLGLRGPHAGGQDRVVMRTDDHIKILEDNVKKSASRLLSGCVWVLKQEKHRPKLGEKGTQPCQESVVEIKVNVSALKPWNLDQLEQFFQRGSGSDAKKATRVDRVGRRLPTVGIQGRDAVDSRRSLLWKWNGELPAICS